MDIGGWLTMAYLKLWVCFLHISAASWVDSAVAIGAGSEAS